MERRQRRRQGALEAAEARALLAHGAALDVRASPALDRRYRDQPVVPSDCVGGLTHQGRRGDVRTRCSSTLRV
eukprot:365657-Pleurochrysis_carterae.AAC.1